MRSSHVTTAPHALAPQDLPALSVSVTRGAKLGLGVGATAFVALAVLASRARPNRLDIAITKRFQRQTTPVVAHLMHWVSSPGYAPFTHSVVMTLASNCWAMGRRRDAIFSIGTMGAGFTTGAIKMLVGRPRPGMQFRVHKRQLKDNSFPSGHATHYTAFYGYVFFLTYQHMPIGPLRLAIMAYCAGLVALVGPSRIYLGHHWASDVLAGQLVGCTYLVAMLQLYRAVGPAFDGAGKAREGLRAPGPRRDNSYISMLPTYGSETLS
jgi:membrane-associated phospholipid phosphatase